MIASQNEYMAFVHTQNEWTMCHRYTYYTLEHTEYMWAYQLACFSWDVQ